MVQSLIAIWMYTLMVGVYSGINFSIDNWLADPTERSINDEWIKDVDFKAFIPWKQECNIGKITNYD